MRELIGLGTPRDSEGHAVVTVVVESLIGRVYRHLGTSGILGASIHDRPRHSKTHSRVTLKSHTQESQTLTHTRAHAHTERDRESE